MTQDPLNIVILGASFAGLSAAHYFLNDVKSFKRGPSSPHYRVILVSPSNHLYWNIGAPRALVSSTLVPTSECFVPINLGFKHYSPDRFVFIQGTATSLETSQRKVTVALGDQHASKRTSTTTETTLSTLSEGISNNGLFQTVPYHALILATGTSAFSPLLSLHGTHEKTLAALKDFHERVQAAETIVIVGGGPSGVECAGQLATYFNYQSWWSKLCGGKAKPHAPKRSWSQRPLSLISQLSSIHEDDPRVSRSSSQRPPAAHSRKTITLVSGHDRLLPKLRPSVGLKAETKLKRLGVHVVHGARLITATETGDGKTTCIFSGEWTARADVYLACTGVYPNTAYVPADARDPAGYVITDPEYLRAYAAGDRVYALGDCASYSKNYTLDVFDALPVLMRNLRNDLLTYQLKLQGGKTKGEVAAQLKRLEDAAYEQNPTDTMLMPLTKRGGVGVVFDIRIPSFAVHLLKGRDYRFGKARKVVVRGRNPYAYK